MKFIKYFILSIALLLQANLFTAAPVLKKPIAKPAIKAPAKPKKAAPVKVKPIVLAKPTITPVVKPIVAKPVTLPIAIVAPAQPVAQEVNVAAQQSVIDPSKESEKLFLELIKKTYTEEIVNPNALASHYFSPDLKKYANLSISSYLTSTTITIFDDNKFVQIDLSKKLTTQSWISSCAWSSDSKYLILNACTVSNNYCSYVYQILIINTLDTTDIKSLPSDQNYTRSVLSPDNSLLAMNGTYYLKILDPNKNTELYNKTFNVEYVLNTAWSHNSCSLAILLSNNTIKILNKDLKSGKWIESKKLIGFKDTLSSCTWSPDGSKLLLNTNTYSSYGYTYQLSIHDLNSHEELTKINIPSYGQTYYWVKDNLIHSSNGSQIKIPELNSNDFIKTLEAQPTLPKYAKQLIQDDAQKFFNLVNTKNLNEKIKEYFTKFYLESLEKTKKIKFTIKSLIEVITENNFLDVIPPNTINAFIEKISKFKFDNISQTKQHFLCNLLIIFNLYKKHAGLKNKDVSNLLLKIYAKEKEEYKKGNYVFYHGRFRTGGLLSEIYKNLWTVTKKQTVKDNFVFFRFNEQKTAYSDRTDYLFMNHALFGNAHETTTACTLTQYFLSNKSVYQGQYTIGSLFKQFKLVDFYEQNKADLQKLEELYLKASKFGEVLLISIPSNKVNLVRIVSPGGYPTSAVVNGEYTKNTENILNAIKTNQQVTNADYFEWSIPATTQYLLDPINGPDVYSFQLNDEKLMREYNELSQKIFDKLKIHIAANSTHKSLWGII